MRRCRRSEFHRRTADPAMAAVAPPQCPAYVSWSGMVETRIPRARTAPSNCAAEPEVQKLISTVGQIIRKAARDAAEKEQPGKGEAVGAMLDLAAQLLPAGGGIPQQGRTALGNGSADGGRWSDCQPRRRCRKAVGIDRQVPEGRRRAPADDEDRRPRLLPAAAGARYARIRLGTSRQVPGDRHGDR